MAERTINKEILNNINKFIEEIRKHYNVKAIILFGSYAKGTETEDSDIDIAIVSDDFDDIYDCMADLMGMTWKGSTPFIEEVMNTGIKVA